DSDGASDIGSESVQVVQVANVAPSVTAPADQSTSEGSSHSFALGSFSDPGDDSPWHVTVNWGDGSFDSTFDVNTTGTIPAQDHTYADGPNDHAITVDLVDEDGSYSNAANPLSVHVDNVPPHVTLSASNDPSVDEGSTHSYHYSISDPGQDIVSTVSPSCGVNGTLGNASNNDTSGSFDCTFP